MLLFAPLRVQNLTTPDTNIDGTSIPSGIFVPSILVGATFGRLVANLLPHVAQEARRGCSRDDNAEGVGVTSQRASVRARVQIAHVMSVRVYRMNTELALNGPGASAVELEGCMASEE